MCKPILSVIMPVYNGDKFLHQAIDSILTQTFSDFEFIIINDGSYDKTEEIILSYNDPRIIYIKNNINLKLIKTLNFGIDIAKGEYIARMDADDISLPTRFEKQIQIFKTCNEVDIVNINAFHLEEEGLMFREQNFSITLSHESLNYLISLQNFICHPGVMVRSDLMKSYKYLDQISKEHIEDFDLWNRMLRNGCLCFTIKECLIYYRNNKTSINHTTQNLQIERMLFLCNNILFERFKIIIEDYLLEILLGRIDTLSYRTVHNLNNELVKFISSIRSKTAITDVVFKEMTLWRKQKIINICLKSLLKDKFCNCLGVLIFIFLHLQWFNSCHMRKLIYKLVFPEYKKLDIKNVN